MKGFVIFCAILWAVGIAFGLAVQSLPDQSREGSDIVRISTSTFGSAVILALVYLAGGVLWRAASHLFSGKIEPPWQR